MDQSDTAAPDTAVDLSRFHSAQKKDFETALREIREGRRENHWVWFVFPQIRGIGHSSMSRYYAIEDMDEAVAFLQDPALKENLLAACRALMEQDNPDASEIFGWPDDLKVKASMTLFDRAARELALREGTDAEETVPGCGIFRKVLERFYEGSEDSITVEILKELEEEDCYA